ncbi:MAG: FeoB-associated Cys-rich membrane protein [Candidatus Metalachnospira sp.]|nr:FeoB-associated Cys-rich membrane protein [Candidatus Metalachnospira sp.]
MAPSTIIGLLIVVAVVVLIIRQMIKNHKNGVCHCGSSCSSCNGGCGSSTKTKTHK